MRLLQRLASILRWIIGRDQAERDLDDEMQAFVAMAAADKMRGGASAAEARRMAVLDLGGIEQAKERVRAGRHGAWLDDVGRDVKYALRTCARTPAFSATVVATLALGIGATTAVFTIVNGVLLRPLPYRDPTRLVMLFYGHHGQRLAVALATELSRLRRAERGVRRGGRRGANDRQHDRAAAIRSGCKARESPGITSRCWASRWHSVAPFAESDAQGDGDRDRARRTACGGVDSAVGPDVVNSTTTLDGRTVTIVGVASADAEVSRRRRVLAAAHLQAA